MDLNSNYVQKYVRFFLFIVIDYVNKKCNFVEQFFLDDDFDYRLQFVKIYRLSYVNVQEIFN